MSELSGRGAEEPSMSQATVLILDDDVGVSRLLHTALTSWGLTAEVLGEPDQVLEAIRVHGYDLLLLDVVLPGLNGLDILPVIQDACPSLKVIIMTGYADKAMAIDALRAGAFDFLEKPIDLTLLHHTVKRAIEAQEMARAHRQTLDELRRSQVRAASAHRASRRVEYRTPRDAPGHVGAGSQCRARPSRYRGAHHYPLALARLTPDRRYASGRAPVALQVESDTVGQYHSRSRGGSRHPPRGGPGAIGPRDAHRPDDQKWTHE